MMPLSDFMAAAWITGAWVTAIICGLDLVIHSPLILFLAKNAPGEHKNHYLTAFTIFLLSIASVFLEPTFQSFILLLALNISLLVIHTIDQLYFEARRDLPPIEAACHTGQLLGGGLCIGLNLGYCLTLWGELGIVPEGWVFRDFGPWAWTYVPFLAVTGVGLISHGVEMIMARGPKKINERWQWSLRKVLTHPIFWLPDDESVASNVEPLRQVAGSRH